MQKFSQNYNWIWQQYKTRKGKNTENKHIGPVFLLPSPPGDRRHWMYHQTADSFTFLFLTAPYEIQGCNLSGGGGSGGLTAAPNGRPLTNSKKTVGVGRLHLMDAY